MRALDSWIGLLDTTGGTSGKNVHSTWEIIHIAVERLQRPSIEATRIVGDVVGRRPWPARLPEVSNT